jgi:DNA-binding beta-propeller fold protein YncE
MRLVVRISNAARFALSACVVAVAVGCSSGGAMGPAGPPVAPQPVPRYLSMLPKANALSPVSKPATYAGLTDLYVTEPQSNVVYLFTNRGYDPDGAIRSGLSEPYGAYLDKSGNLYVANAGGTIAEYAPGGTNPSFTYSAGMVTPVDVSVDGKKDVFEADVGIHKYYRKSFVNEYAQRSNHVMHTCSAAYHGQFVGVAVDQLGDVFVADDFVSTGAVVEYKGGLKSCNATYLISLDHLGGMAIDKNGNLIVCDGYGLDASVDVIAPPYKSITRTLGSGYNNPTSVRINKKNTKVFVTDAGNDAVYVIRYSSGAIVKTLGVGSNPSSYPYSAVDGPNAVY